MVKLTTLKILEYQITGKNLCRLSVPAKYNGKCWDIDRSKETVEALDTMLEAYDPSLYQEWLEYKEGEVSSKGVAFQERLETPDGTIDLEDGSELVLSEQVTAPELTTISLEEPTKQEIQKALDQLLKEAKGYIQSFLDSVNVRDFDSARSYQKAFKEAMTTRLFWLFIKDLVTKEEREKERKTYARDEELMCILLSSAESFEKDFRKVQKKLRKPLDRK
jgi:hypothetical protein